MNLSNVLKTALMATFPTTVDVFVYTGTLPSSANVMPTGILLVHFEGVTLNATTSMSLVAVINANALADGTVGYARLDFGPGNNYIIDLPLGSGFTLSTTSLEDGQAVRLQTLNITL